MPVKFSGKDENEVEVFGQKAVPVTHWDMKFTDVWFDEFQIDPEPFLNQPIRFPIGDNKNDAYVSNEYSALTHVHRDDVCCGNAECESKDCGAKCRTEVKRCSENDCDN